jgi:hypothetical protein
VRPGLGGVGLGMHLPWQADTRHLPTDGIAQSHDESQAHPALKSHTIGMTAPNGSEERFLSFATRFIIGQLRFIAFCSTHATRIGWGLAGALQGSRMPLHSVYAVDDCLETTTTPENVSRPRLRQPAPQHSASMP